MSAGARCVEHSLSGVRAIDAQRELVATSSRLIHAAAGVVH
jgi:hypothetical protein